MTPDEAPLPFLRGGDRKVTGPADVPAPAFDPLKQVQPELVAVAPILSTGTSTGPDGAPVHSINLTSATGLVRASCQLTPAGVAELIERLEAMIGRSGVEPAPVSVVTP